MSECKPQHPQVEEPLPVCLSTMIWGVEVLLFYQWRQMANKCPKPLNSWQLHQCCVAFFLSFILFLFLFCLLLLLIFVASSCSIATQRATLLLTTTTTTTLPLTFVLLLRFSLFKSVIFEWETLSFNVVMSSLACFLIVALLEVHKSSYEISFFNRK